MKNILEVKNLCKQYKCFELYFKYLNDFLLPKNKAIKTLSKEMRKKVLV